MNEGVVLATYPFYGGDIRDILFQWEQIGVFSYLLPFLLIFAIVYGILTRISLFGTENKSVNAVISVAVGLLALQFQAVPFFFSEIFPRVGIGITILLIGLIFLGLFMDPSTKGMNSIMLGFGAVILFTILFQTAEAADWYYSNSWIRDNASTIFVLAVIAVGIGLIIASGSKRESREGESPLERALRGR